MGSCNQTHTLSSPKCTLLYTKIHDFATLKAELSFGCDSVRYTSVKKVYGFDCNSDVVWCFASCTEFVDVLLYTKIHDFATLEAELSFGCDSVRYTSVVWCFASCT